MNTDDKYNWSSSKTNKIYIWTLMINITEVHPKQTGFIWTLMMNITEVHPKQTGFICTLMMNITEVHPKQTKFIYKHWW